MTRVCIIGARSGSKSISDKNLQNIKGKSLLEICLSKAIDSGLYDKIYLSTDSLRYAAVIAKIDNVELVLRPVELSSDSSHEFEYIEHVIRTVSLKDQTIISRMQCTSPFQSINSMQKCLELLENSPNATSVQLITETPTSIYKSMHIDPDTKVLEAAHPDGSIQPGNRQRLRKSYVRSNFYCFKLHKQNETNFLGN